MNKLCEGLPGEAMVTRGLRDLLLGRNTAEALLVEIIKPHLIRAGVHVANLRHASLLPEPVDPPEIRLFRYLQSSLPEHQSYLRYKLMRRQGEKFRRALTQRARAKKA